MLISSYIYFKTVFRVAKSCITVCFTYSLSTAIVTQDSVATRFGCGAVFKYIFVTNFLQSLMVKEFENRSTFGEVTDRSTVPWFLTHGAQPNSALSLRTRTALNALQSAGQNSKFNFIWHFFVQSWQP